MKINEKDGCHPRLVFFLLIATFHYIYMKGWKKFNETVAKLQGQYCFVYSKSLDEYRIQYIVPKIHR